MKVIGTRIGKRVTGVLMTLNIETVIGQQDSGLKRIPSTWRSLMASLADCLKTSASRIPWYRFGLSPLLKNRWVQIGWSARSCFAQLQDVGPCGEDDFEFVFGNAALPSNAFGAKAGLDVSPAVRRYLGMNHNNLTYWRFADESDVLEGPWMEIVTTSGNNR